MTVSEYAPEYDVENQCLACGEHISDPHAPGCSHDDDSGDEQTFDVVDPGGEIHGTYLAPSADAAVEQYLVEASDPVDDVVAVRTEGPAAHTHFGYWINQSQKTARCYGCGFQFLVEGSHTAEVWENDRNTDARKR